VKAGVDCGVGPCSIGLRRGEEADDKVKVTAMSRRALSYSIDNLLSKKTSGRRELDDQSASAASARLHSISQQRIAIVISYTVIR